LAGGEVRACINIYHELSGMEEKEIIRNIEQSVKRKEILTTEICGATTVEMPALRFPVFLERLFVHVTIFKLARLSSIERKYDL
jgi:hypothetical protein